MPAVRKIGRRSGITPRLDISVKGTGSAEAIGTTALTVSSGRRIASATGERGGARNGLASLRHLRCPAILRGRIKQANCRRDLVRRLAATVGKGRVERGRGHLTGRMDTRRADQRRRLTSPRRVMDTPPMTAGTQTSPAATPAAVLCPMTREPVAIAGTRPLCQDAGTGAVSRTETLVRPHGRVRQARSAGRVPRLRCRQVRQREARRQLGRRLLQPARAGTSPPRTKVARMSEASRPE